MKSTRAYLLASAMMFAAAPAFADDYTDLLNILRDKGSLTSAEYSALMAKHMRGSRTVSHGRGTMMSPESDEAMQQARSAATSAAASAAAAEAAMQKAQMMSQEMETAPGIVHADPYTAGKGISFHVGAVDLNFSAILNGFYTYSSAGNKGLGPTVAGGLADASGFDSSAIRNGLLPGAFIVSASTTQEGIDMKAVFGVYPGINSTSVGLLNANNGGTATALGTSGVDFRQSFFTFGTKDMGTVKIGRDIGIFGSDAILNDATLLSVGSTGGNADPGNTSLGRIGYGYIYTDFMPQITYISPTYAGFQATVGVFQPLNEFSFSGLSATAGQHSVPMFQGKVTYDYKGAGWSAHLWAGALVQPQQQIVTLSGFQTGQSKTPGAGEVGALLNIGPFGILGYYYRGTGVGTTGEFFDGLSANGSLRDSEGGYVQGTLKITPKIKLAASYGTSNLYLGSGDVDPNLVARNESEVGAVYYSMTDWVTLVGEIAHSTAKSHGSVNADANAFTLGGILFY